MQEPDQDLENQGSDSEESDTEERIRAKIAVRNEIYFAVHQLFTAAIHSGNLHKIHQYIPYAVITLEAICPQYEQPALILAARLNNTEIVTLLLKHKADPNVQELKNSETALVWAARHQNKEMIQQLVSYGAVVSDWSLWETQVCQGEKALTSDQIQNTKKLIEESIEAKQTQDAREQEAGFAALRERLRPFFGDAAPFCVIGINPAGERSIVWPREPVSGIFHAFNTEPAESKVQSTQAPEQVEAQPLADLPAAIVHLPPSEHSEAHSPKTLGH